MRRGQVALYLVLVLVALCLLAVMNVGVYLSVSNRNKTMNAGDAAALAVANWQGELLNRIGRQNLEHLQHLLETNAAACARVMEEQARTCFLEPLEGIRIGSEWAQKNGITEIDEKAAEILRQHVIDVRTGYAMATEYYPEPWEGAWTEYATRLESILSAGLYAAPDNIDFMDNAGGHVLLNAQFYNAVSGRSWCWFRFNAPGLPENYTSFRDWPPLPSPDDETRRRRSANSEIYSLHLERRQGSALQLFGKDLIQRLTGFDENAIEASPLMTDPLQVWYFYDTSGLWRNWWEIDPDGEWAFPVVGKVKPEYDVRGCAACCRVRRSFSDVIHDDATRTLYWTAAAKPFGTGTDAEGRQTVVTEAAAGLVLPVFTQTRLVPWDAVGGRDTERPNLDMLAHIRRHLPAYLLSGPSALEGGCFYCEQLRQWEQSIVHTEARQWLRQNATSCRRSTSSPAGGSGRGGTPHGH